MTLLGVGQRYKVFSCAPWEDNSNTNFVFTVSDIEAVSRNDYSENRFNFLTGF